VSNDELAITTLGSSSLAYVARAEHGGDWHGDPAAEEFTAPSVIFTTRGTWTIHRRGNAVRVDPSVVVLGDPGSTYACSHAERKPTDRQVFVAFRPDGLERLAAWHPDPLAARLAQEPLPAAATTPLSRRLHGVLVELQRAARHSSSLLVDTLAVEILLALHFRTDDDLSGAARGTVREVSVFIEENYGRDISLADIAAAVHVSPFHLHRRFRAETGLTPHAYLTAVRVRRAEMLLLRTDMSILNIALAVGFKSPSHFASVYRSHKGMTPRSARSAAEQPF
jgi:AraC-like DNA-binding protein